MDWRQASTIFYEVGPRVRHVCMRFLHISSCCRGIHAASSACGCIIDSEMVVVVTRQKVEPWVHPLPSCCMSVGVNAIDVHQEHSTRGRRLWSLQYAA
eukprot:scaffold253912_cov21-Tisochrysis_lutea.AAC.2